MGNNISKVVGPVVDAPLKNGKAAVTAVDKIASGENVVKTLGGAAHSVLASSEELIGPTVRGHTCQPTFSFPSTAT